MYPSICTACFVIWRPCRAAETSKHTSRQGFFCCRTASMEQSADRAEAAAVDQYFLLSTEVIAVPVCLLSPGLMIVFVMCCRFPSKVKVAHTRLPSMGFRSLSRFLAVSLQVMQLPSQPLRRLLPILLLGEQRHDGCEQFT